ncbi:MAG TPA: hypothetical protein PK637_14430, partial [Flavobacteriales bacterium]|nr:hypothetical protein [Flavobacteriales bacterium]
SLAVVTTVVYAVRLCKQSAFGGDDQFISSITFFDEIANKFFAGSFGISVGRINKISACIQKCIPYFSAFLFAPYPHSSPNVIVPKHNSETRSPLLPNNL